MIYYSSYQHLLAMVDHHLIHLKSPPACHWGKEVVAPPVQAQIAPDAAQSGGLGPSVGVDSSRAPLWFSDG